MIFFILPACLLLHPSVDLKLDLEKHELALEQEINRSPINSYFLDQATLLSVIEARLNMYAPVVYRNNQNIQTDWVYSYKIVSGNWVPIMRQRYKVLIHGDTFWKTLTTLEIEYPQPSSSDEAIWKGHKRAYTDDLLSVMLLEAETEHLKLLKLQTSQDELMDVAQKHLPHGFQITDDSVECDTSETNSSNQKSIKISAVHKEGKIVQNKKGQFASFEQREFMTLSFSQYDLCQGQMKEIRFNDEQQQGEWQELYLPDPRSIRSWLFNIINDPSQPFLFPPPNELPGSFSLPLSGPDLPQR